MKYKRTKIICTIGPSTESFSSIKKLHEAGMNVARLNMSHSDHKNAKKIIDRIKKLNQSIETPVGILLDTQGPEIRTGDTSQVVNLEPGQLVSFTIRDEIDVETTSFLATYKRACADEGKYFLQNIRRLLLYIQAAIYIGCGTVIRNEYELVNAIFV